MPDDLTGCIELLKARTHSHRTILQENETLTRAALIDPFQGALGRNISGPALS